MRDYETHRFLIILASKPSEIAFFFMEILYDVYFHEATMRVFRVSYQDSLMNFGK